MRTVLREQFVTPLRLPLRTLALALGLVAIAAVVLGAVVLTLGRPAANAAYLSILLLLAPTRRLTVAWRLVAAGWGLAVAVAGTALGPLRLGWTLVALVVICLVQALFRTDAVGTVRRSPVNFVAFSAMPATGIVLGQVALGAVIGILVVLIVGHLLGAADPHPDGIDPLRDRLRSGILLAAGCVILVVLADAVHFPKVTWALLSFCIILSADPEDRRDRAWYRVLGTVAGALLGTALGYLPAPVPLVVAVICGVLCVAYIRAGAYTLFVTFLTPAILLTSSSLETSPLRLAGQRLEAVLAASVLAVALTALSLELRRRREARGVR